MTPRLNTLVRRGAAALFAAALLAAPGRAQEPRQEPEIPPLPGLPPAGEADPREEMERLFREVEQRLREIDDLLYDAAAGETTLPDGAESGISGLLEATRDESRRVVEDIDRILEIARSMSNQQSSSGSSGSPPPQGESPLDEPRGSQNRDREDTPQAPGEQPEPSQEDDQPPGQERSPQDQDGEPPESDPQMLEGSARDEPRGEATDRSGSADTWGELPVRVRQVFRAEGADDMPVQYRDWIDAYYRRLNRTR